MKKYWSRLGCNTLGKYSDLYLKINDLQLVDAFKNFRDMCTSIYNLDSVYYYKAPGLSFDCMLKYTNIKLKLLTDHNMHLLIKNSIRDNLTKTRMRYTKTK